MTLKMPKPTMWILPQENAVWEIPLLPLSSLCLNQFFILFNCRCVLGGGVLVFTVTICCQRIATQLLLSPRGLAPHVFLHVIKFYSLLFTARRRRPKAPYREKCHPLGRNILCRVDCHVQLSSSCSHIFSALGLSRWLDYSFVSTSRDRTMVRSSSTKMTKCITLAGRFCPTFLCMSDFILHFIGWQSQIDTTFENAPT